LSSKETPCRGELAIKFCFLTADGHFLPLAYHLQEAGHEVYVGMIRDWKEVKMVRNESPEDEKRRVSLYQGMFKHRTDAASLVRWLEDGSPQDWFVFCDFNYFWPYADRLRGRGFHGLLPTKEDQRLEKEREFAKDFVAENYPELDVAEYQNFKTVQDAQKYLDKHADQLYCLKGNSDECPTVVPSKDDPKINRELILDSLGRFQKWYEKEGFSLEEKIPDIIEFTPEAYGYDGELVSVSVDIEHKHLGSRGGPIEGCALSLVLWQDLESRIYEYFLKPLAKQMLRPREFTIWDMSVYWSPSRQTFFFGEFCSNRPGYDCVFAEIASTGGVEKWVEKIVSVQNFGQDKPFGTAMRVFNKQRIDPKKGWQEMVIGDMDDPNFFGWDIRKEGNKIYTIGYDSNTYVIAGSGDTVKAAINDLYKNDEHIVFDSGYSLEKRDWFDKDWPENILHRYEILKELEL
jgi:hypothetical protein